MTMSALWIAVLVAVLLLGLGWVVRQRRQHARAELQETPLPKPWTAILERTFPLYNQLSDDERERLHGHIQLFLDEKSFEGLGGLELTDEMRLTIAGQACLLRLNLDDADPYSRLRSILVYPSTVTPVYAEQHTSGVLAPDEGPVLGQSWGHGTVILAWDNVQQSARIADDGHNVVFHEFAHQLDQEDGEADGVPYLDSGSALRAWGQVLREHYAAFRDAVEQGENTLLDEYGATNPAEFFAVATEFFFEKPIQLQRKHPALYEELASYYRQDPAGWHRAG